eukprot:SAG31_NODE_184_length_20985_cov_28.867567_10_plen_599_part_00
MGSVRTHRAPDMPAAPAGFDPSGFERAAKALKEINRSPHADQALRLQIEQERTRQAEASKVQSQNEKQAWDSRQKYLEQETEEHKKRADYADELARKRTEKERDQRREDAKRQEAKRAAANERIEAMRRQTEARVQAEKRATIAAENEAKMQSIRATELAKAEGAMRVERHNEDLTLRRLKLQAEQQRVTFIEVAQTSIAGVSDRVAGFFSDRDSMLKVVGITSSLFLTFHTAKVSTRVVGNYVASRLGRPALVRETSRKSYLSLRDIWKNFTQPGLADGLGDIVLPPVQRNRISSIAEGAARATQFNLPHRHLLLYGPPGTGKTMFGKLLAKDSGMDFAILTGGDVSPLGKDAVTEMHKVFDWANRSRKGTVIFIDEAEAFLRAHLAKHFAKHLSLFSPLCAQASVRTARALGANVLRLPPMVGRRDRDVISEEMRAALNAFLYHTGTETDKFMLVLASNQPQLLDTAVLDRVDSKVLFDVPGPAERRTILDNYWASKVEAEQRTAGCIDIEKHDEMPALLDQIATRTAGLSGRQLMQLMNSIKIEAVMRGATSPLGPHDLLQLTDDKVNEAQASSQFSDISFLGSKDTVEVNNSAA